jgi:hypothetical protein
MSRGTPCHMKMGYGGPAPNARSTSGSIGTRESVLNLRWEFFGTPRGCTGSPRGPCSRRPSPACWSTRPTSSRSRGARATCWMGAWIAQVREHGLVGGSFVPPAPIRELRDLTRYRKRLIEERTRAANRRPKLLWRTPGSRSPRSPPTCSGSRAGPCSRRWGRARPIRRGWPTGRAASCGRRRPALRQVPGGAVSATRSWSVSGWLTWTIGTRRSTRLVRASLK